MPAPALNLYIIPNDLVRKTLTYDDAGEFDQLRKVVEKMDLFEEAGMTPMCLMNLKTNEVFVVAKETFGKKLN